MEFIHFLCYTSFCYETTTMDLAKQNENEGIIQLLEEKLAS